MTVLKIWDGSQWVENIGPQGPAGPQGSTGPQGPTGGGGFYGINVKQIDYTSGDIVSKSGISTIGFDSDHFYITQNDPNTDEVTVNFRDVGGETVSQVGSITVTNPARDDKILLFHKLKSNDVTFEHLMIGVEGTKPAVTWNIHSGPVFGTNTQSVFDTEITSLSDNPNGDIVNSFDNNPVNSEIDSWVWLEVFYCTGTVDFFRLSAWQRTNL